LRWYRCEAQESGHSRRAIMTETQKFRTERLVARSWQIEDLPLALELWGDPAVTALIDSGKLTNSQVGEKLRAEIERERSDGVQYWALFDHRNGELVGCCCHGYG
jgi:RimJ/RimL family protein N-acetyltransferase